MSQMKKLRDSTVYFFFLLYVLPYVLPRIDIVLLQVLWILSSLYQAN